MKLQSPKNKNAFSAYLNIALTVIGSAIFLVILLIVAGALAESGSLSGILPGAKAQVVTGLAAAEFLVLAIYFTQKIRLRNTESVKASRSLNHEIMQRHRTNEDLRVSERHNRDIIEKSLGFICTYKLDGTLLSINPAAANSLGYDPGEMIGRKATEFMPASAGHFFEEYLRKILRKRELSETFEIVCKSGEIRVWEYKNTLYEKQGEESYILGYAVDVTERNRMETELKNARNAAIESARIKSEFLANMSHEIRTPMNGVLGMTELLAQTRLDETQREYIETIKKSGESLLAIINDILDFSKIEAGKLRFDTIDFDLRNTIENSVELFAEQAANKRIELASLVKSDVEVALRGDPGRLRQVLTNLIGNAVKFTEKGEIIVRVEKERETKKNIVLRFSVCDTGIGISPETKETLFQAFTQADSSITRRFGGTGLGLAISKQLVEMMNGEIGAESEIGRGSTFTFTAVFEKQPARQIEKQKLHIDLKNLRTLVVDDNETNRKILLYQINSLGIGAEEAAGGKEALEKLREAAESGNPYNLVILDLLMPEMDGFKLAREIRADAARIGDVRLILMPSYGRRGHGRIAKKFNIDGYLIKPVRQADLFDCISAVTDGAAQEEAKAEDKKPDAPKQLITQHTIKENRYKNKELILIVEDNAVNQKLIKIQLEKIGFRADVVDNGAEALKAIDKNSYALILMDCQMPEMDGYAATEEIRRRENGKGRRTPVIAITANVMPNEIKKCFTAGMDDCLAKPFTQNKLEETIGIWLKKAGAAPPKNEKTFQKTISAKSISGNNLSADNLKEKITEEVQRRVSELEDEIGSEVVDEIISLFAEDAALRMERLRKAIDEKDFPQIKIEAHGLKGSCGNIGACLIFDLCFEIETQAKAENIENVEITFKTIDALFPDLLDLLKARRSEFPR